MHLLFNKNRNQKYILFIVQNEVMFRSVCKIYEIVKGDQRFCFWFYFLGDKWFYENNREVIIHKNRLPVVSKFLVKRFKWDLVIQPSHYRWLWKGCKRIFVNHGLGSGKKIGAETYVFGSHARDRDNEIIYHKIFVNSHFVAEKIKESYPDYYPRIRVVGDLDVDDLPNYSLQKEDLFGQAGLDINRPTILIASTWGPLSLIQNQAIELVEKIPEITANYNLIFSVHLNNFLVKINGDWKGRPLIENLYCKNVYLMKTDENRFPLLANADLLITDSTALGLYFPFLGRPIIYYDCPELEFCGVSLIPELRRVSHVVKDFSKIELEIEYAFAHFDRNKMQSLCEKICSYRGRARERFKEEIWDSLTLK